MNKNLRRCITDLLLTGVLLVIFALGHHVLPPMLYRWQESRQVGTAVPVSTPAPTPAPTSAPAENGEAEPQETEETDTRTDWQKKFAEHFTDEVVRTENSYSSPNLSVTLETKTATVNNLPLVWYVADIHVGNIDCFATYFAGGSYSKYYKDTVENMSREVSAVLAMNGDFYNTHRNTSLVRNGVWYTEEVSAQDICVLLRSGELLTLRRGELDIEALKAAEVWQSWCFGPALLDENGAPAATFNMSPIVANAYHPWAGIGYYEPGHYCLVLVDGRHDSWSHGMTVPEFAVLFSELGCKSAYNLDGGGSAAMAYEGEIVNHISDGARDIADILYLQDVGGQEP